jgi:hypothetical protein
MEKELSFELVYLHLVVVELANTAVEGISMDALKCAYNIYMQRKVIFAHHIFFFLYTGHRTKID